MATSSKGRATASARSVRRARITHPPRPNAKMLTVPQVADECGVQEVTVWHWIYNRQIESVKIGRARRIPRSAIDRIIEHGTVPADRRVAIIG